MRIAPVTGDNLFVSNEDTTYTVLGQLVYPFHNAHMHYETSPLARLPRAGTRPLGRVGQPTFRPDESSLLLAHRIAERLGSHAMWASIAAVAIGGALGSVARYLLTLAMTRWVGVGFPWGTLAVNIAGSFLLGVIIELWGGRRIWGVEVRIALGTGVMGGFTTYSSFNLETIRLFEQGAPARGGAYLAATVLGCLLAGVAGLVLARAIRGPQ